MSPSSSSSGDYDSSSSGEYDSSSSGSSLLHKPVNLPAIQGGLVLVTGGSGFIASHIIFQLLTKGYDVRTSVRDVQKHLPFFRALYLSAKPGQEGHGLRDNDVWQIDLGDHDQEKWDELVEGCDYVIHTASPFDTTMKEKELCKIAENGAERLIKAVANAKHPVRKTIFTSSFGAVSAGHKKIKKPLDDDSWSIECFLKGYEKSKYIAEKKAWKVAHDHGILLETVCPGLVVGPMLGKHHINCTSSQYISMILSGDHKAVNVRQPYVDVRDVAEIHVKALTTGRVVYKDMTPITAAFNVVVLETDDAETIKRKKREIKEHKGKIKAAWDYKIIHGNRYMAAADDGLNVGMLDACHVLGEFCKAGGAYYKPAHSKHPDWIATMFAGVLSTVKDTKYYINFTIPVDTQLAKRILEVEFKSYKKALGDHVLSMMTLEQLDLNGYDLAKVAAFAPYPLEMKAWKEYAHGREKKMEGAVVEDVVDAVVDAQDAVDEARDAIEAAKR